MKTRKMLTEATPYLSNLLKNERYIYNHVKYQSTDSYVNTCGSHVCHRIYRLINDDMDLAEYHRFMKDISVKNKMGFDPIVATFVKPKLVK